MISCSIKNAVTWEIGAWRRGVSIEARKRGRRDSIRETLEDRYACVAYSCVFRDRGRKVGDLRSCRVKVVERSIVADVKEGRDRVTNSHFAKLRCGCDRHRIELNALVQIVGWKSPATFDMHSSKWHRRSTLHLLFITALRFSFPAGQRGNR